MIPSPFLPKHLSILFLLAAALPLSAAAQPSWPSKPIKLIVPFPAGASNDVIARALANKLSARLGQPFVIDNRVGAGGTIGTDLVAKSPPDGYTLLFISTSLTTNAASGKKLPYDPQKDLDPIALVAASPFVVTVNNEVKARTLREFLALAREKPKGVNYGSAGTGGISHLGVEMFSTAAGIQMTHVPYKGIGAAFTDMMGGNVQMALPSLASALTTVKAGKLRALAVTGPQRSPLAPEIPTASESGMPGFRLEVWFGMMGPAHLPPAVAKRLNEEINAIISTDEFKEVLARDGSTPRPGTPEEFGNLIKSEIARWTKVVKDGNIEVE